MLACIRSLIGRRRLSLPSLGAVLLIGMGLPAGAQTTGGRQGGSGVQVPAEATVESLFVDFLHYAVIGRFTAADAYAKALLAHPELEPVRLLEIADENPESIATLLRLIRSSSIGDSAARVLDVIQRGEHEKRKSADRILRSIELLAGGPQQEFFGIKYLRESGEYAIPHMVQTLLDPARSRLWPRVINALPLIGKPAVNPLVIALRVRNNDVRLNLIHVLGEIGYPQAIPYLRTLILDRTMPNETKVAARRAIARIEQITGRSFPGMAQDRFFELAQQYYNEDDAVRADPRLDEANIWYWDDGEQALRRVVAPVRVFGPVMAMRCCEEALRVKNDHAEAIALWLAANIRREHRLGMNVESGDPNETGETDPTRPDVFPRALYFTQTAGPRYAHLVLERAVRQYDSPVALGAIEALRITAGESSLIGTEDYKQPLVRALQFPDRIVRIRAALALGAALPKSQFAGSQLVVPVLATALVQTGREQMLVVDADEGNARRVAAALRAGDRDVIMDASFFAALDRARTEFQALDALFIASDVAHPPVAEALHRLRAEFIQSKTPVVVMTKPRQAAVASGIAGGDPYVETVPAGADDADLLAALERVRARTGQTPLDADLALSIALQAAETLRWIAVDGRTVFDVGEAEPALIAALDAADERLQVLAASVLALLPTPTAQRAVAHVALDAGATDSLRVAAFGSLAESAKSNGNLLETGQIDDLVTIARDDADLTIRTAASQSLGAINLATNKASEIIRSYYGG